MRRVARAGGVLGTRAVVLLAVVPTALGSTAGLAVPFAAHPSYRALGAVELNGTQVGLARPGRGLGGSNTLRPSPAFNVSNGSVALGLRSLAIQGGAYGLEAWAGLARVDFTCGSACNGSGASVVVRWDLVWTADLDSNCTPSAVERAHVAIFAVVRLDNLSAFPARPMGGARLRIYEHAVYGGAPPVAANGSSIYPVRFDLTLAPGTLYDLSTYVIEQTYAHASTGCGSRAGVQLLPGSGLPSIRVT